MLSRKPSIRTPRTLPRRSPPCQGKADKTTTITAGTGLTGGGDLSANRTLAVSYGATAGTACQGNDSRITGAVQSGAAGSVIVGTLPTSGVTGVLYVVP